jgi:hypothetical protein
MGHGVAMDAVMGVLTLGVVSWALLLNKLRSNQVGDQDVNRAALAYYL